MERTLENPAYYPQLPEKLFRKRGRRGRGQKKKKMGQLNSGILTDIQFSEKEMEVLSKGLKCAPDSNVNKF